MPSIFLFLWANGYFWKSLWKSGYCQALPGHSVFSSYLLIKHISSAILGWLLYFGPKWKDFAIGNFFYRANIAHHLSKGFFNDDRYLSPFLPPIPIGKMSLSLNTSWCGVTATFSEVICTNPPKLLWKTTSLSDTKLK